MKILHVINNLGSGGAEKLIEDVIPLMEKDPNIEVQVLLLSNKVNVYGEGLKNKGIKVSTVKINNIYNPFNVLQIKKFIKTEKIEVVHTHLFPTQYWVAFSKNLIKNKDQVKYITTEHSANNKRREKKYFRLIEKFVYFKYDYIISINETTQSNLISWLQPNKENLKKFKIVKNGIDVNRVTQALPYKKKAINESFDDTTRLICMVGRFTEAKDHLTLIRAVNRLPSNVHLLLLGEGPLKEKTEKIVKNLSLEYRVHFLGFRHDTEKILKSVDIVVLASHWEGLSLASLEGLASGNPFIASKVQGLEEIVEHYGLLFEPGDIDGLTEIILRLLSDNQYSRRIAEKGLQRARMFDLNRMIKELINLYHN